MGNQLMPVDDADGFRFLHSLFGFRPFQIENLTLPELRRAARFFHVSERDERYGLPSQLGSKLAELDETSVSIQAGSRICFQVIRRANGNIPAVYRFAPRQTEC